MIDILYIDEQEGQSREFEQSAYDSPQFSDAVISSIKPMNSLEETLAYVMESHCRALVTDYKLSEFQPEVEFTGADLVRSILKRKAGFPCFVATSYALDATAEDIDVNMIYPKEEYLEVDPEHPPKLPFFLRVERKINEYSQRQNQMVSRFEELIQLKEQGSLNADEFEELLALDGQIEAQLEGTQSIVRHIKADGDQQFANLIHRAEELLENIEAELAEHDNGMKP